MCKLSVLGSLNTQDNVEFIAEEDALLEIHPNGSNYNLSNAIFQGDGRIDLYIDNEQGSVSFNSSRFSNVNFESQADNLVITGCTFDTPYAYLNSSNGNVSISNSTLTNYALNLSNFDQQNYLNEKVSVIGCNFTGPSEYYMEAIIVHNYGKYHIQNNSIENYYIGIDLSFSGDGRPAAVDQLVDNNVIFNCASDGINAYNSKGIIYKNNIYNNYYGVRFLNNCNFQLFGDQNAQSYSETQQIADNSGIEVYAASLGFPTNFRYNTIRDWNNLGNPDDPLVFWDVPEGIIRSQADVRCNNWGTGFNPPQDLGNNNVMFLYDPVWLIPVGPPPPPPPDKVLYENALTDFVNGNDAEAEALYKSLIVQYPYSLYAEASMKDLLRLEQSTDQDYTSLQDYYSTNDSIQSDSLLLVLSNVLVNDCNVKLENFPAAINYYESVLDNPLSEVDSIYAIIDLGYVYTLMEQDGLKSNYTGRYTEHKPCSIKEFQIRKNYLLSLIPSKNTYRRLSSDISAGSLSQNYPNPTLDITMITYSLNKVSNIFVRLVDNSGKTVKSFKEGNMPAGVHKIEMNVKDLPTGIYFYSLFIDGNLMDTKKINIIR